MKRSTLIILAIAAALCVGVYFLEIREGAPSEEPAETTKAAFSFKQEDIASITLARAGETITIENQDGKWVITGPLNAPADESAISSLARSIADARIERTLTASDEEIKSFGLSEPAVSLEVKLKSGEQHALRLGSKDFSGLSVYARIGDQSGVALLPASVLTSSDKPLDDLRDRSVLGGVSQYDIKSLTIDNENGRISLVKEGSDWKIKSPIDAEADDGEMNSLLSEITSAKVDEFVNEKEGGDDGADLGKFGLEKPAITLTAGLEGGERILSIGKTDAENYYARASNRSQVIKIESSLYEKLNLKVSSLRNKEIVKIEQDEITRVEITNPHLKLVAEKQKENEVEKWVVKEPADKKDKEFQSWKVFSPLESAKADDIIDSPSAAIRAKLARPAVQLRLTSQDGKTTVIKVSKADDDNVYIKVEGKAPVYKVEKNMLEQLSFKIDDAVLSS